MRFGIFIYVLVVAGIAFYVLLATHGIADGPTAASAPRHLKAQRFPNDLVLPYESAGYDADAVVPYEQLFALYHRHTAVFDADPPYPEHLVQQVAQLLVTAMHSRSVGNGFLDDHIPLQPEALPNFGAGLESVAYVGLFEANALDNRGDGKASVALAQAVFALGHRAFAQNRRLYNRWIGLVTMMQASVLLEALGVPDLQRWSETMEPIEQHWQAKIKWLNRLEPPVGDVINVALHDEDVTFRIRAMLVLGRLKFNPGHRGNLRIILKTIDQAEMDKDALVRKAGAAAKKVTREARSN